MQKQIITKLSKSFEDYAYEEDGIEFWFARDLQKLLGYSKWENFAKVVGKAKESCINANQNVLDHFPEVRKMVTIGSEAEREIEDIMLTRYACYLIAQNGESRKQEIAFAQSYFAIQTRKQELIEERIALSERLEARKKLISSETELSKLIYERGVDESGFARIRSKGDHALFGGLTTYQVKMKMNIPNHRPMADFLPTVTISAKNFATEITNFNVRTNNIQGEPEITHEHVKNNTEIRQVLTNNNIIPENIPPEEDIKKLERRVKKEGDQIANAYKKMLK
ncbi:MAG: DNA damage-inducible protein D [Methanosarcinaceae archaeon]|nr:DNA damage-inducible protein D [Methanosarcinaceae archaeon]